MAIAVDDRWMTHRGIGRFAKEVLCRLKGLTPLSLHGRPQDPIDPVRLAVALSKQRCDLFFSPGYNAPLVASVPFVFTMHDLIHLRHGAPWKALYYATVVRRAALKSRSVLTVSESSRREILEWTGLPAHRVVVVGNGVGQPFVHTGARYESHERYLLYVGNTKPHKNVDRLIAAFAESRAHNDVRLVLCCANEERVQGTIRRWHLGSRATILDSVVDQKLAQLYRGAIAVVVPSLCEGFGLPALEGMACGSHVVLSDIEPLREIAGSLGIYVDPRDTASIAAGLDQAVYPGSAPLQREARIARSASFSWDAVAARVAAAIGCAAASPEHTPTEHSQDPVGDPPPAHC